MSGLVGWARLRQELQNICDITEQILHGLLFIHRNNEVHRDLSLHNGISKSSVRVNLIVLFSSKTEKWKIADFGLTSEGTSNRLINHSLFQRSAVLSGSGALKR